MSDWLSGILPGELRRRVARRRRNARTEDVDDAIQDVLLGIVQKLRQDQAPAAPVHPDAYLLRAVQNRLNSLERSERRRGSTTSDDAALQPDRIASPELSPEELHEAGERSRWLARLVTVLGEGTRAADDETFERAFGALQLVLAQRLSDPQWILIRMRVLEGTRIVDCARALGVSVGTAHNWTRDALAICRATLEEAGIDAGRLSYETADRG